MPTPDPPDGYSLRVASLDDASSIADLVNEVNVAEVGFPWTSAEETRDELSAPDRVPENDLVLVGSGGEPSGYLSAYVDAGPPLEVHQLAFVKPALWGRGLSAWLLRWGEDRARSLAAGATDSRAVLRVSRWEKNEDAAALFTDLGYAYVRSFHQMRAELTEPVAAVPAADGLTIGTFDRTRDAEAVHRALMEVFEDHWGHVFSPFDRWVHDAIEGEGSGFDPGLWFVAREDDEVVGAITCRASTPSAPDTAHVDVLGVRRAWRNRGLGEALLLTAFAEVRRRRILAVELVVDSESQTGATRLYERAGMRRLRSFEHWQKEIAL